MVGTLGVGGQVGTLGAVGGLEHGQEQTSLWSLCEGYVGQQGSARGDAPGTSGHTPLRSYSCLHSNGAGVGCSS